MFFRSKGVLRIKNTINIKQTRVLLMSFVMLCTLVIMLGSLSVRTVYADEMNIPENATVLTEQDFPFVTSQRTYYKIIPERDEVIGCKTNFSEEFKLYQEQDGKCVPIDGTYIGGNIKTFHVLPGNTYYFSSGRWTASMHIGDSVKVTFDPNGGSYEDKEKYYVYLAKDNYYGFDYGFLHQVEGNIYEHYYLKNQIGINSGLSREGYYLHGWYSEPNYTGANLQHYKYFTKDITFYAQWDKYITVTMDPNGGYFLSTYIDPDTDDYAKLDSKVITEHEGSPGAGAIISFGDNEGPFRNGFKLKCWNTSKDGSGITCKRNGDGLGPFYEDTMIYAIWVCRDGNHNWIDTSEEIPATYSSPGKKPDKKCTICGEIQVGEVIPQLTPADKSGENGSSAYPTEGTSVALPAGTVTVTSAAGQTVAFTKAPNKNSVTVPATVTINGKKYSVTEINANAFKGKKIRTVTIGKNVKKIKKNAFKGSAATKLIVKTKKLKKATVKGSLKGSKVKTIQVKVGKKADNKKYVKTYKKIFTKSNAGKKVIVK